MKKIVILSTLTILLGMFLSHSCTNPKPTPKIKTWADYRKPYENLAFKNNENAYEQVGIEHNAMLDYYKDYVKIHPVNKPNCGDYWEDPDCQKINSAIRSGLKLKASFEKRDSNEYMKLFEQSTQGIQILKGQQSAELKRTLSETSQYKDLQKEVSMLNSSNFNTFEEKMTKLLKQVEDDKTLDENQKRLLSLGITVGKYSAYYHVNHNGDNSRMPLWVAADILGAMEGCALCLIFCPECALVGAVVFSLSAR